MKKLRDKLNEWFDNTISLSKTTIQALQTLFYISHVLFILQCVLMIIYMGLIEPWHVLVLELNGFISILSPMFNFNYNTETEEDEEE